MSGNRKRMGFQFVLILPLPTDSSPQNIICGYMAFQVYARDAAGRSNEIEHSFSLDGTTLSFRLLSRIALMTDAKEVVRHN